MAKMEKVIWHDHDCGCDLCDENGRVKHGPIGPMDNDTDRGIKRMKRAATGLAAYAEYVDKHGYDAWIQALRRWSAAGSNNNQ